MTKVKKYSLKVRERAVRLVFEHQEEYASQWAAISSIAEKSAARRRRCGAGYDGLNAMQGGVPRGWKSQAIACSDPLTIRPLHRVRAEPALVVLR